MFAPQNQNAPLVLDYIEQNPCSTAVEVSSGLGVSRSSAERQLKLLLKMGLVFVTAKAKSASTGGRAAAMYSVEPGKVRRMDGTRRERRNAQQRNRRAISAVKRKSQEYGGVFGIIMAQLT